MPDPTLGPSGRPVTASWSDTLRLLRDVIGPTIAKSIFARRYRVVGLAARVRLDRRAVERMARLRERYGPGPLLLPVPGATQAVLLSHDQVLPVLRAAPEPWMPASDEKRAALAHFEPDVSLASRGMDRTRRRALNDRALEWDRPVHSRAARVAAIMAEEMPRDATLDWDTFHAAWSRAVRRIVLGDGAADDQELTAMLLKLRQAGNWAMFRPYRRGLMERFHARLADHIERAEPGALVSALPISPDGGLPGGEVPDQVTHWLFAFDPGGMATFRALALLAAHGTGDVRDDVEGDDPPGPRSPLRVTMLESLRLWPTTPAILREAARDLEDGTVQQGTNLTIFAPYHHRAPGQPAADHFEPALWSGEGDDPATAHAARGLVPFSAGPAACPARHLVPMVGALGLRALLRGREVEAVESPLRAGEPLPATLDNSALSFRFR